MTIRDLYCVLDSKTYFMIYNGKSIHDDNRFCIKPTYQGTLRCLPNELLTSKEKIIEIFTIIDFDEDEDEDIVKFIIYLESYYPKNEEGKSW